MRRVIVVLLLTLALAAVGTAQLRNHTYGPGELASDAVVAVVVDRFGIAPQSVQRPVGAFLLCVRNRRGDNTGHFSLTLDTAGAAELLSLDTSRQKFHGAILVDLQPGKYRLRVGNSPDLSVAIEIK